jgi:hypothetical protein
MSTGGSLPGLKRPGREVDHSLSPTVEVKNAWGYIHLQKKARVNKPPVSRKGKLIFVYLEILVRKVTTYLPSAEWCCL